MPDPVELQIPQDSSKNIELTKYYTFNETGNIMLATTVGQSAEIQESVRKVFAEVSVFFAAMTKAISTTTKPNSSECYSLYSYEALEKIISGSGCFIRVTEMDLTTTTSSWGATFSKTLIKGLLGLATGVGALSFAEGMISAIGNEGLKFAGQKSSSASKVGNIVFVCEYLLGMPSISAIVVYIDAATQSRVFTAGPCVKYQDTSTTFVMHKDTYMFVTPTFIREYAGDLTSVGTNEAYGELVKSMQDHLTGKKQSPPPEPPQDTGKTPKKGGEG
jgi:hypothetical protein